MEGNWTPFFILIAIAGCVLLVGRTTGCKISFGRMVFPVVICQAMFAYLDNAVVRWILVGLAAISLVLLNIVFVDRDDKRQFPVT